MKKLIIAVAVVGLLGFAGIQIASAHGGYAQDGGYGYCGEYYDGDNSNDNATLEKFRSETNDIRKGIVVKRSELRALLQQDNPDEKRVAQLTGEIFDLETELNEKAADKGVTGRSNYGHGSGMMWGYGHRNGRHMMDW
jgi:hypothetical protein